MGNPRKLRLLVWLLLPLICVVAAAPVRGQAFGCSASAANPIVCENSKQGNPPSQWDISGAGDPSIQGFATEISVNQGQAIYFKVNTDASAYRIDIYRMGYYGGQGARLVASVLPSVTLPQSQPACLSDASTGLIDCGNWAASASWQVPANATSGIYIAKLVRLDTGGASHMVFVVRADTGGSQILFQTSDTTWQAYNDYGGNSLYTGSPAGRAYKVSYNRPFNTRAANPLSWFFGAEYPMVRWLEANGYDVSYFTGVDTDQNGSLIPSHKVLLSAGDDEYWSGNQRAKAEAARAAGVHLAFFTGSGVFWKTRWENSIDGSNSPYRTLVCYKETLAGQPADPADPPTWTGTWRDPRFSPPADGGRPENALTGTLFSVQGVRNDAITVPASYGKLRFWRNTAIAALQPGETYTFPAGTLGYVWDQEVDNGFRPAGLFDLSSTSLDVSPDLLGNYGSSFGPGTATHNLALYRAGSGALVFGAGTAQWSWGLDATHDSTLAGPLPTDPNMQQATVNLLADMGVQPGTLQLGLVAAAASTDVTPPSSDITSPSAGSIVPLGVSVTITGTAVDSGGGVVAGVDVSLDGGTTWHRAVGLGSWSYVWTPSSLGAVTLKSRAVDDSGNLEFPSSGVTVEVTAGPMSLLVTPANASIGQGGTQQFTATATFSDGSTANLTSSVIWTSSNTGVATISSSGLATGVGAGSATIQAHAGSVSGSSVLTIGAGAGSTGVATSSPTLEAKVSAVNKSVVPDSTTFPYVAYDMYINFEECTAAAAPTTTCLASSTAGSPTAWAISDPNSYLTIQTAAQAPDSALGDTGKVGLSLNLSASGTNGSVAYLDWTFPAGESALSLGLWYYTSEPGEFVEGPHFLTLINNSFGQLERIADENDSTTNDRVIRLSGPPAPYAPYEISVNSDTWYWCTLQWIQNGTGTLSVYSLSGTTFSLVGSVTFNDALVNTSDVAVTDLALGNYQATTGAVTGDSYTDDLIVDYTTDTFPLLPSSTQVVPVLTSISPTSATAGAAAETLTLTGTNFLSTSTVTFGGTAATATYVSATELTIPLSTTNLATGGIFPVIVTNPGVGPSGAVNFTVNNPAPTLTSISPTSANAGAAAETITLTGTNFVSTSTVTYGGAAATATYVSKTQLTLALTTANLATGGTFAVVVTNPTPGGGTSATVNFTVDNLKPTITSLSPSSANVGAAAETLTITGTNFVSTSTVTYGGVAATATYVSATQLTIPLSTTNLGTAGTYAVVVTNPTPGGGASTGVNFTVDNLVPTITSLSPASANVGAAAQTLTITGTSFVSTSTATYNAVAVAVTYVSATELTIPLTAANQATAGTYPVVVSNPTPGGGASNSVSFTVDNLVPTITSLSPASANVGAAAQTLTITGTNFVSTSTVTYNGVAATATYKSATQLTIPLTAANQATAGTYPVVVTNLAPGGGSSTAVNFTVNNLAPTVTSISPTSANAGAAAQTLTITGTNFVSTSTVTYGGVAHTVASQTATQLTIALTVADQATGGTFAVVVTNPTPGGGSSTAVNFTVNNLVPTITSFSPASANAGAAAQTVTITGTNFVSTSTVTYNALAHTPTLLSPTALTIPLTVADQATGGNYPVVVTNPTPGGGASAAVNFTVNNLVPTITSFSPASANAGAAAQTLTITGTNFVSTSTVTYNALAHTPTLLSPTQLTIPLTVADQATGGTYAVVVTNPTPGGGASAAVNFTVNNLVPTITSLSPASALVGAAAQTLTITGTNFVSTSTVTYNALAHTPTLLSPTQLTIPLTTTDQATAGADAVVVTNPTPGGGTSAAFNFAVDQAPAITSANSTTFTVGTAGTFTVTATGYPAPTLSESGGLPSGVTFNASTGVLSGTPAAGTGASYSLTFTAQNGVSPNATQTFTLTVDQAPAITSASSTTFQEGTAGTFTVIASGYPAPTLSETGTLPSGVTFNATTGVLSGTPATSTAGTYSLTFTAQNGIGSNATQAFTLTVNPPNQAPAITSASSTTFAVGVAGAFTVTATGFPAPTFSETGTLPSGVTFNATTGVLSGTPVAGTGASYSLTITAQNGVSPNATQTFTLIVDQAPAITSASSTTFLVGTAGTFTVTATGFPASTFSETGNLPSGVTLNATTGVLSGTPAAGTGGSYPLTLTAENGISPNATQTFTLTVNQVPAITSASSTSFQVGAAGTFTVTATGYPAPTFSQTGTLPSGVTFNTSTGVLSGTPVAGTGASYSLTFTATNSAGSSTPQTFTLTVDQAPAITSASSTTFLVGTAGTFTVTATGYPPPTFSETGTLPGGVTLNANTGVLSGTPAAGAGGSYSLTLTAENGISPNATQTFTLTVNQAPAITSASSTSFQIGTAGTFTVTATGYPVPTLSESGTLPSGVSFNASTGVLSGTPATGTTGTYSPTFTAQNGIGSNATQTFTLTVYPANQAPAITSASSTSFQVGTAGTFTVTATGYPAPTFSETGALPSGVTFNAGTAVLSGTPAAGTGGSYPLTFTAQNGISPNATQTFTLTVNQAPAITSPNSTAFAVGAAGSFTVTATGYPVPTLSESGTTLPSGVTFTASTGVLSGTPATGTMGAYSLTFTAQNGISPNAAQTFTLTVNPAAQAPAITSANSTTFQVGTAGSFMVTATGSPTPTFTETGALPNGVTFNTTTGVLSGTPVGGTGGTYPLTFTAENGITPNATQSFTLTVDQAPAITSANSATFLVGAAGTFTVTASGFPAPTSFTETGTLPSGVTFNTTSGVLSGTPASGTGASYSITFTVTNGISPNATQTFTLTVQDFTVAAAQGSPTSATVNPGSTATYNLSIAAVNGLSGSVSFTCTGAPSEANCTVSPSPVTLGTSGASTTVSVTTTAPSAVLMRPKPPAGPWIWMWMLALLAAVGTWLMGGRRLVWRRAWAPLAVAMLSVALWAGCGGGGGGGGPHNAGTPAGTYNLTVTATVTSGTATSQHTLTLTLTVN
jgi:hypothetical protein